MFLRQQSKININNNDSFISSKKVLNKKTDTKDLEQPSAATKHNYTHEKDIEIMHLFAGYIYMTLRKKYNVADVKLQ